jgi:hypothetical protein
MRKYRDAINYGAKIRGEHLLRHFCDKIDEYLKSYKKLYTSETTNGKAESKDADPITFELHSLILKWAAEDGNTMVLFWTQTQWNCMSRPSSIDPLGFQHMKVVTDSHAVVHDRTKADQEGERCFAKHIFANGDNWLLCQRSYHRR